MTDFVRDCEERSHHLQIAPVLLSPFFLLLILSNWKEIGFHGFYKTWTEFKLTSCLHRSWFSRVFQIWEDRMWCMLGQYRIFKTKRKDWQCVIVPLSGYVSSLASLWFESVMIHKKDILILGFCRATYWESVGKSDVKLTQKFGAKV